MNLASSHHPIFLWGMPGVGKSTVGRALATKLGRRFIDLDERITAVSGQDIPSLFSQEGEAGFRRWEARCLEELLERSEVIVVALGGGALIDPQLRTQTRKEGCLVCLAADPETIVTRLQTSHPRPMLPDIRRHDALQALLEARASAYADCDVRIDTDGRSVDEVTGLVLGALEMECAA